MEENHSGITVTTTIETETKPESTAQLADFSANHGKQDTYAEAEEGRIEFDNPVQNEEFSGSRTSSISGHDNTRGLSRPAWSIHDLR